MIFSIANSNGRSCLFIACSIRSNDELQLIAYSSHMNSVVFMLWDSDKKNTDFDTVSWQRHEKKVSRGILNEVSLTRTWFFVIVVGLVQFLCLIRKYRNRFCLSFKGNWFFDVFLIELITFCESCKEEQGCFWYFCNRVWSTSGSYGIMTYLSL